jgi:ribosomal protein S18 acetylase RimI-like enzyme
MLAGMAHLKSEGLEETRLWCDELNTTGAKQLYARLGFAVVRRSLSHQKDLCSTGEEER